MVLWCTLVLITTAHIQEHKNCVGAMKVLLRFKACWKCVRFAIVRSFENVPVECKVQSLKWLLKCLSKKHDRCPRKKKSLQYFNDGPFIVDSFVIHKKSQYCLSLALYFILKQLFCFFKLRSSGIKL